MKRRALLLGSLAMPLARANERVDIDLSDMKPGDIKTVTWSGQTVFIRYRTEREIESARRVDLATLRDPEPDENRVVRDEWLIVLGSCTHGGCTPSAATGRLGGWYCLCHGSVFDTSGRVREGPALENLTVPPYRFRSSNHLEIGRR